MTYYFVKDQAAANQWQLFTYMDGQIVDTTGGTDIPHPDGNPPVVTSHLATQLNFNADGSLASTTPAVVTTAAVPLSNGANPLTIVSDFTNNVTTQYASSFSVNTMNPNGSSTGRLTGLDISEEGLVRASYTNGISVPLGKLAMADFPNSQGLSNVGNSSWDETIESGAVVTGEAGTGRFGLIQSGALETSNVDLTAQLVNLITAQRNFQANARSIETSNTLTQTIIQIR